ncbi:DUF2249 domain-containing protein [uncultured Thiodictyon sp.]|uniref:DUF2249 domain-containing protein n=1 Tax=uncultured Thiodictyon sp. TaxID=1846217 RepID=UPI0025E38C80|nr:DUF2249 domain-containing protein [uncultured Thiodictyon sp.]
MPPQVLDVRTLPPPEPLERVLDALTNLPAGGRLWVLHRREPFPLYDMLQTMGYSWRSRGHEGHFEILIWDSAVPPTRAELSWNPPC